MARLWRSIRPRSPMFSGKSMTPSSAVRAASATTRHWQMSSRANCSTRNGSMIRTRRSAALGHCGERALVELVSLVGYYSLVRMTLNALEVPLVAGMVDPFPDRP